MLVCVCEVIAACVHDIMADVNVIIKIILLREACKYLIGTDTSVYMYNFEIP